MKPPAFRYIAPNSLEEALDILAESGEDAKVLAGGQSLVPLLNLRLAHPALLCDINHIPELSGIAMRDNHIALGSTTRHQTLLTNPLIAQHLPLLTETAHHIGHWAIRQRGTLGGSLAHADPAAELGAVAVLAEAQCVLRRQGGYRTVGAMDFFQNYFSTCLEPHELLTEIDFPLPVPGSGAAWTEVSRRPGDFALVGVGVQLEPQSNGAIGRGRIVLAGVGPIPYRPTAAERLLQGSAPSPEAFTEAAREAARQVNPPEDIQTTAAYRRHLVEVLVYRALSTASQRMQRA